MEYDPEQRLEMIKLTNRWVEESKKIGDVLVINIAPDEFVDKGPDRSVFLN